MAIETRIINVKDAADWGYTLPSDLKVIGPDLTDEKIKRIVEAHADYWQIEPITKFKDIVSRTVLFAIWEAESGKKINEVLEKYSEILKDKNITLYRRASKIAPVTS